MTANLVSAMTSRILPNIHGKDLPERNSSKNSKKAGQQELQFVNLPNNLKLDIAARKRVRSHVARDFRRRAKVPGYSSVDADLNAAKSISRERRIGQKHRFRFDQDGLHETGKQSTLKVTNRKVSAMSQDSWLTDSTFDRNSSIIEDSGGIDAFTFNGLKTPVATEYFMPSQLVNTSDSLSSGWDDAYSTPNQSNENSKTLSQQPTSCLTNSELVCRGAPEHRNFRVEDQYLTVSGSADLDPFIPLPVINNSSRIRVLMHHFHLRIMASPLMMNPRKEWFALAIQDHALLHVALSHAAGNLSLLMRKGDSTESQLHRLEAVRIINVRLSDVSCGISDGTIGAVASIASYEATNGTLEGVRTHMDGLEQIVKMRGGLEKGGFSAHLRRLIAWADLNSANALSTTPRFSPLSDRQHLQSDQFAIDPIAFQLYSTPVFASTDTNLAPIDSSFATPNRSSNYSDVQHLTPKLAYCFITLRQLARLLNISGPKAVIRMDHTWYSDMAYTLQRRLMQLGTTFNAAQQTSRVEGPCCIAALIFLECCIREIHPRSRIVETLVRDLKASLLKLQGLARAGVGNLIFWALAVGVAASGQREEREWFVTQLSSLASFLGVTGWEGARGILQGVLWPDREGELTRALVWAEVEMANCYY